MDLSASIIEMIREGDLDDQLTNIQLATGLRLGKINGERQQNRGGGNIGGGQVVYKRGQQIKITGHNLRPKYLFGQIFTVKRVNAKTVVVDFPVDSAYGRFSGASNVRIPKSSISPVTEA